MSGHFKPNRQPFVGLTYEHILRKKKELLAAIESHRAAIENAKQRSNMSNYIRQINSEITYTNKGEKKTIKGIIDFSLDKIKDLEKEINRLDEFAMKRFPMEITSATTAHSNSASSSAAAATTAATPLTADTNNYKTSINSDLEDEIRDPHIAISMANIKNYGEKLPEDCNGPTCKIMGGRRRTVRARSRRYKKKTSRSRKHRSSNKK
jgi:hypothetical protein